MLLGAEMTFVIGLRVKVARLTPQAKHGSDSVEQLFSVIVCKQLHLLISLGSILQHTYRFTSQWSTSQLDWMPRDLRQNGWPLQGYNSAHGMATLVKAFGTGDSIAGIIATP